MPDSAAKSRLRRPRPSARGSSATPPRPRGGHDLAQGARHARRVEPGRERGLAAGLQRHEPEQPDHRQGEGGIEDGPARERRRRGRRPDHFTGVGGNLINTVRLGDFDLVAGGAINLTGGVGKLYLRSVAENTQVHLRDIPNATPVLNSIELNSLTALPAGRAAAPPSSRRSSRRSAPITTTRRLRSRTRSPPPAGSSTTTRIASARSSSRASLERSSRRRTSSGRGDRARPGLRRASPASCSTSARSSVGPTSTPRP